MIGGWCVVRHVLTGRAYDLGNEVYPPENHTQTKPETGSAFFQLHPDGIRECWSVLTCLVWVAVRAAPAGSRLTQEEAARLGRDWVRNTARPRLPMPLFQPAPEPWAAGRPSNSTFAG
jgi:hypothetical protein